VVFGDFNFSKKDFLIKAAWRVQANGYLFLCFGKDGVREKQF